MSNTTIINRILEVIEAFERGETSASAIAACMELHEPALEAIPREARDNMHDLSVQVIMQDITSREEELLGLESSEKALHELKSLLMSLI